MQPRKSDRSWLGNLAHSGVLPGLLLILATALALAAANSAYSAGWFQFFEQDFSIRLGNLVLDDHLSHWINDGLMVLFFFFIGLEIKHEVIDGQLQSMRAAALPVAAALGGMLVPAMLYAVVAMVRGDALAAAGWGIPMATDIAFALGLLAILGKRVPTTLKVFLATLAIVDDLGAVLVIAVFYTAAIEWHYLATGLVLVATSYALNRLGVRRTTPYALLGIAIWLLFLESGVHATIAGVALAFTVPARRKLDEREFSVRTRELIDDFDQGADPTDRTNDAQLHVIHELAAHCIDVQAPLQRMEHALKGWIAYVIVPLFALSNAGVDLSAGLAMTFASTAAQGVALGLLLGKPVGVLVATWLACKLLRTGLPAGVTWQHLHGTAWLAGVGFTMSLFVNELAFHGVPESYRAAKVAVLVASALAGAVGLGLLLRCKAAPASRG